MKKAIKYPKGVKVVYDDGGKSIDRYTVYYSHPRKWGIREPGVYALVGMSAAPFHPQGFGQHGEGRLGRHNGRKIRFEELPEDCQRLVRRDLEEE